eukprot:TRINITY_DN2245_c0_g2_i2.p1 TRINITY_DN2245_c0_g2~~TRINITY_DN2245_c0_g2_i2.p1  ORF type:complete len:371 (-),score=115.27 TRINITY_DN2245_c0_g2_i2:66-1178(-)
MNIGSISAVALFFLLLVSSLTVNLLQIISTLVLYPFTSAKTRISLNQGLANLWWDLFDFCLETWSGSKFVWTGDSFKPNEISVLMGNHGGGLDFVPGIVAAARAGVGCGKMITLMKRSLKCLPTIGWMHYFQGSLFLDRNWETDSKKLSNTFAAVTQSDYPKPYWVGIYPEGTRITPAKKEKSHAWAKAHNLPLFENVLLPREKGFIFVINSLRQQLDSVYDCTIAYEGGPIYVRHALSHGRFKTRAVHLHVRRVPVSELPDDDAGLKNWLIDAFQQKDKLLEHFNKHGHFPGNTNEIPPPNQSLLKLFSFWSIYLLLVSSLVSTYLTLFLAVGLVAAFVRCSSRVSKTSKSSSQPELVKEARSQEVGRK